MPVASQKIRDRKRQYLCVSLRSCSRFMNVLCLAFAVSLAYFGETYGEEDRLMGRWPIKPEMEFVDQYGEDKTIIVGGRSIRYTEWVRQVFDELVADLPNKAYDLYRKKFEQGVNYVRLVFEENDAFPITFDIQEAPALPGWILDQIKNQLEYEFRIDDCSVRVRKNFYDNQFIYSTHTSLIAYRLDDNVIKNHLRCLSISLGINPKESSIFYFPIEQDILFLRKEVKEQYWKLK